MPNKNGNGPEGAKKKRCGCNSEKSSTRKHRCNHNHNHKHHNEFENNTMKNRADKNSITIAIPVVENKINSHFGHTKQFYLYTVKNKSIETERILNPPPHQPGSYPKWLAEMGVTDVIAGGMGQRAIASFNQNKINVFVGVPVKSPKDLVEDFINGVLETSDNCCDH